MAESSTFTSPISALLNNPADIKTEAARSILNVLLKSWGEVEFPSLTSASHIVPALFSQRDPELLSALRTEIEDLLWAIGKQDASYQDPNHPTLLAINNLLSLYVMLEPQDKANILVPQKDKEGKLHLVEYQINRIELTPQSGVIAAYLREEDRVFSYGLTPVDKGSEFNSLLIHCGTGWDTAQGELAQHLNNYWVGKTPGEKLYLWGQETLNQWIVAQERVCTMGHSLGGSLAFLSAYARPDKVVRADALNPPGQFCNYERHPIFGSYFSAANKPEIVIQRDGGDRFVNSLGFYDESMKLLNVTPDTTCEYFAVGTIIRHLVSTVSHNNHTIEVGKPVEYNRSFSRDVWHNTFMFYRAWLFAKAAANFFVFSPIWAYMTKHSRQLVLFAGLTTLLFLNPAIVVMIAPVSVLTTLLLSTVVTSVSTKVLRVGYDLLCNRAGVIRHQWDQFVEATGKNKILKLIYCLFSLLPLIDVVIDFANFIQSMFKQQLHSQELELDKPALSLLERLCRIPFDLVAAVVSIASDLFVSSKVSLPILITTPLTLLVFSVWAGFKRLFPGVYYYFFDPAISEPYKRAPVIEKLKSQWTVLDYLLAPIRFILKVSLVRFVLGSLIYRGYLCDIFYKSVGLSAEKTFTAISQDSSLTVNTRATWINGLRTYEFSPKETNDQTVYRIFLAGIGGSCKKFLDDARQSAEKHNAVVRVFDHPGIGVSEGRVNSQRSLVNSVLDQVDALLAQGVPPEKIILSGHSMGAAAAIVAAGLLNQAEIPVNVFADRTFADAATVATDTFPLLNMIWNLPLLNITLKPIVNFLLITPLLYCLDWAIDPGSSYLQIPTDNRAHVNLSEGRDIIGDKTIPLASSLEGIVPKEEKSEKSIVPGVKTESLSWFWRVFHDPHSDTAQDLKIDDSFGEFAAGVSAATAA